MECTGGLELCQETMDSFREHDYFIVFRADSGYQDISLRPPDGVGLQLGADFRAFVEPRRTNPVTNEQDGGIFFNSQGIIGDFAPTVGPNASDTIYDDPNPFEPWWHERFVNQTTAKPLRNGIEVHDLVLTFNSDNDFAKETAIHVGDGNVFPGFVTDPFNSIFNVDLFAGDITYFDAWMDPFGVLRQHFVVENSVGVRRDISDALVLPVDQQYHHQWSFESIPFFNHFFDTGQEPFQPRSTLYQLPQTQPTMPAYNPVPLSPNFPDTVDIAPWPPQFDPLAAGPVGFVSLANAGGPGLEDDIYQFQVPGAGWVPNQFEGAWLVDQKNGKYRITSNSADTLILDRGHALVSSQFSFNPASGTSWLIVSDVIQQGQYPRLTDWPFGYKNEFNENGELGARAARILKQHVDSTEGETFMRLANFTGQTAMLGINLVGVDDIIVNADESQRLFLERMTVAFWGPDFDPNVHLATPDSTGVSPSSGVALFEDSSGFSPDGTLIIGDGTFTQGDRIVPLKDLEFPQEPELIDLDGDLIPDDLSGDGILNPPGVGMEPMDLNGDGVINSGDGLDEAWVVRVIPDDAWVVPFTDSSVELLSTIPTPLPFTGFPAGDPDDDGEPPMDEGMGEGMGENKSYHVPGTSEPVHTLSGAAIRPAFQTSKALNTRNNEGDDLFVVVRTSRDIPRFQQFRAVIPSRLPERGLGTGGQTSEQLAGIELRPAAYPRTQSFHKSNPEEAPVQDFYGHDMLEANVPASIIDLVEPGQRILPGGPPTAILGIDVSTNRGDAARLGEGTDGVGRVVGGQFFYNTPSQGDWTGPAHDPNQVIEQWLVALNCLEAGCLADPGEVPEPDVDRLEAFRIVGFNGSELELEGGIPRDGQWMVVQDPTFLEQVIVEFYDVDVDREFNIVQDLLPLGREDPANGFLSGVSIYRDNDLSSSNTNGVFDPGVDLPLRLDDPPVLIGVVGEPETQVKFVFSSPGTDDLAGPVQIPHAQQPRLRQIIPDSFGLGESDPDSGPDFFVVIRPSIEMDVDDDFQAGIVGWGPNTPTEPDPDQFTDPSVADAQILATEFDVFSEYPWGSRALGFISFFKEPQRTSRWTWDQDQLRPVIVEEPDVSQDFPNQTGRAPFDRYWVRSTTSKFGISSVLEALPAPIVDFDAEARRRQPGEPVNFINLSTGEIVSFLWDFGDGQTSPEENPVHIYQESGTYTVSLTVTNAFGIVVTETKQDFIDILETPYADFNADPTSGVLACDIGSGVDQFTVRFMDQSVSGPDHTAMAYSWDFGDGSPGSNEQNPTHIYRIPDTYTVVLEVVFTDGITNITSTCRLVDLIEIIPPDPNRLDTDMDGIPDECDLCEGSDDSIDADGDTIPDACDVCPDFDDTLDVDGDTVPDGCDVCDGADDTIDTDEDGVPDGCDICPDADDTADMDEDGVPDECDLCEGEDDNVDNDGDGIPDGCDLCPGFNDGDDSDGDGVPDECDLCPGFDDTLDEDDDGVPDACDTGTASIDVMDSIGAGDYPRNQHALLPLMDWMPLFNFNMAPDDDDPDMGPVAIRFLENLQFRLIFDPEADDQPYEVFIFPDVSDFLEFGIFREGGDPEEDFDGGLNQLDTLLFTWDNTGFPVGNLTSSVPGNITYDLDFIRGSDGVGGTPTAPEFPVRSGPTTDGQSYIVAFRTSATWLSNIGLAYEVLNARMTPFPLDDMGEAEDSYTPDFPMAEILDEIGTAYSSNFTVYDITGGPIDKSTRDADISNNWTYPLSLYTPHAEFTRPRVDLGQTLFEFVTGELLNLREILPLDGWSELIGINMHSSAWAVTDDFARVRFVDASTDPDTPLADLREVNVVMTDIGADPFGPAGNGGFNPETGLERFFDTRAGGDFGVDFAFGEDWAFNGLWVWADTNNNGIFDPPTPSDTGGANMVDLPMNADFFFDVMPRWEYVPFPPGGGDPWWKIKLRFFGGARNLGDALTGGGFIENIPEDDEGDLEEGYLEVSGLERVDYFVVARTDSGFRDISLEAGDGEGIAPGADFKAFIEPRRIDAVTGDYTGGILADTQIPTSDDPSFHGTWQNDPRWLDIEPWWHQRTHNQLITKPTRTGIEVHDLVMTYRSRSVFNQLTDIPYTFTSENVFVSNIVNQWLDPFGLLESQFLNPTDIFLVFADISVIFSIADADDQDVTFSYLIERSGNDLNHAAFETVPFLAPEFDLPPNGPRSQFFPAQMPSPTLPDFSTWPATSDAQSFPHFTDWDREDRQARLLKQHIDSNSDLTALLGFNLAGSSDPEVNRVNRPVLDEIVVALWGPSFTPADLLPLDPEGDDTDSGAMLWADSLDIGFEFDDGASDTGIDGVFRGLPVSSTFIDDAFVSDRLVPLEGLRWQNAPEPIDLDGDGLADDLDGDGVVDQRDHAWVLTLTPQSALIIPPNDQDTEDGVTIVDGVVDPTGPVNAHGDDLFFVVRTSDKISRMEQFRAFVPAALPSRAISQQAAGVRMTPQGSALPSSLVKSHPEEQVSFNFYDHDMIETNIPTKIANLVPRNTQLVAGGPATPVFGLDFSTNRTNATVETGTAGTGGARALVDTSKTWTPEAFAGKWLIDERFSAFEIVSNSDTRLTLLSGTPETGAYRIVQEPSFFEQLILEFYRATPTSGFRLSTDLLPLAEDQRVSGVAIYRDNDTHPQNRNGVFDPGIDIPLVLDDAPATIGIGGRPDAQVKFVFSSPGTDNWPQPLVDQPRLRQWIPDTFGVSESDPFTGSDFFVVIRPSQNLDEGHDFRMGIVSWGPQTPTEPDPDTFTFPPPPAQPADEFSKFSEFPFGTRGIGFITFLEEPATRYWTRGTRAFQEPAPDFVDWIRSSVNRKVLSGTLTARDAITSPTTIEIDSLSSPTIPAVIPNGEVFELVIRGTNFGDNPVVVIEGYDVTVISATDEAINVETAKHPRRHTVRAAGRRHYQSGYR